MRDAAFARVAAYLVVGGLYAAVCMVKGCSDGRRARDVLEGAGYTEVRAGGWEPMCGDSQCTAFAARGPTGTRVRGVVGCGWFFKACTIRVDP